LRRDGKRIGFQTIVGRGKEPSVGDAGEGEAEDVEAGLDGSADDALADASGRPGEDVQPANPIKG